MMLRTYLARVPGLIPTRLFKLCLRASKLQR